MIEAWRASPAGLAAASSPENSEISEPAGSSAEKKSTRRASYSCGQVWRAELCLASGTIHRSADADWPVREYRRRVISGLMHVSRAPEIRKTGLRSLATARSTMAYLYPHRY